MKTIKETRKKLEQTQSQMGKLLGVSQHRISEIERGVDGRSETTTQRRLLTAIELLADHGLLGLLLEELDIKQKQIRPTKHIQF